MLAKLLDFILGKKCPHCGVRAHRVISYRYARGWNHLCSQACGDRGKYCESCHGVIFETSDEAYLEKLPSWCSLKGEPGRRKF